MKIKFVLKFNFNDRKWFWLLLSGIPISLLIKIIIIIF